MKWVRGFFSSLFAEVNPLELHTARQAGHLKELGKVADIWFGGFNECVWDMVHLLSLPDAVATGAFR